MRMMWSWYTLRCFAAVSVSAALISLWGCGGGGGGPAPATTATVTGSVLEVPSGAGVSGIQVTVGGRSATAGADGKYTISSVPLGDRAFSVSSGNAYEVVTGPPATVAIAGAGSTVDLDAAYRPTYLIAAEHSSGNLPEPPDL